MRTPARWTSPLVLLASALVVSACSSDPEPAASTGDLDAPVTIEATDDACDLSRTDLAAGITTFEITNSGSQVNEVYVYADGDRIVTEKENIGPGTSYELTVDLTEGDYEVACKPGMVGDGIRTGVVVAAPTEEVEVDPLAEQAVADYREYVQGEADKLPGLVQELLVALEAGDREQAKALYAPSRLPWESIEPVAESFGDLDPRIDAREADLEPGDDFTGWHRIEKALWEDEDLAAMVPVAEQLLADVEELAQRTPERRDDAGVDRQRRQGAARRGGHRQDHRRGGGLLAHRPGRLPRQPPGRARRRSRCSARWWRRTTPELATTLDEQFAACAAALAVHSTGGDTFVSYDTVAEPQRQELARAVDALGEPLSQLAAAAAG